MSHDPGPLEDELSRRLADLAATTTTDAGAWERIAERAGAEGGRRRWPPGRPGLWLLAAAAVVVIVAGVGVVLARDGGDRVRTTAEPPAPRPTTSSATETTPSTGGSTPSIVVAPPGTTPGGTGAEEPAPTTPADCAPEGGLTCVGTDSGDVDGDGRPDAVSLYTVPAEPEEQGPVTVWVAFATGVVEEYPVTGLPSAAQLLGVTDLNGDGREEIAYIHDGGAHTAWGWFVGIDESGRLGPVGFTEERALLDGSATSTAGFTCPDVDGDGRNELVLAGGFTDDGVTAQVSRTVYRWRGDVLELDGTDTGTASAEDGDGDGTEDFRVGRSGVDCGDLAAPGW
jgi:hypothetical protein